MTPFLPSLSLSVPMDSTPSSTSPALDPTLKEALELPGPDGEALEFADLFQHHTQWLESPWQRHATPALEEEGSVEGAWLELPPDGQPLPMGGKALPLAMAAETDLPPEPTVAAEAAGGRPEAALTKSPATDSEELARPLSTDHRQPSPDRMLSQPGEQRVGGAGEPGAPITAEPGVRGEGIVARPEGPALSSLLPGLRFTLEPTPAELGEGEATPLSENLLTTATPLPRGASASLPPGLVQTAPSMPAATLALGQAGWDRVLGQRLSWMIESGAHSVEIALDPPELGPLQVRISTQNDQAQVHFVSAQATVRDALEQALPRLRDMLESQGLQLTHADVSDQPAQHQDPPNPRAELTADAGREPTELETTESPTATGGPTQGLVDDYA